MRLLGRKHVPHCAYAPTGARCVTKQLAWMMLDVHTQVSRERTQLTDQYNTAIAASTFVTTTSAFAPH
jgi:hypothetical protein